MEIKHELVIPNEDLPFKLFLFEGSNGNYHRAKHWHRSIEIFLVLEGELQFSFQNADVPLREGDFVIVNSNEVHSVEALYPNITVVVQLPITSLTDYLKEEDYAIFSKQSEELNNQLRHLIEAMFHVYQEKSFGYKLKVHSLFLEALYLLVTEFLEEANPDRVRQKRQLNKLSQITSYMKQHYHQKITLEGVAEEFGFSPTYLSRMFRSYADVSYKSYLINLRTEYGMREMIYTDHSVQEVALNNGFPDSRAFSKAFLKQYGCLPSEYRKQKKDKKVL